jgi:hypothetical protein
MKYRISPRPNTQHAHCFIVRDEKGTHETLFNISKKSLLIWGKPDKKKLNSFMIAYVKKNGWPKEAVDINPEKNPRNLDTFITSLLHGKGKAAKSEK